MAGTPTNMFQAFGSPMLGSTIVSAPRREGDGMDHDFLLSQNGTSQLSASSSHRHRHANLTNAQGTQFVDKVKGQRSVPREPVRAAVKPVGEMQKKLTTQGGIKDVVITMTPNTTCPGKDESLESDCSSLGSSSHANLTDLTESELEGIIMLNRSGSSAVNTSRSRALGLPEKVSSNDLSTKLSERQVEGHRSHTMNEDVEDLKVTIRDLQGQLEVQSKVNSDLKKLLVASMGDDLHHRVDTLVRTRAQLATDIGGYTDRICEDHEMLDKVVIQADMWRSKFKASRVLIDQLVHERDQLEHKKSESVRALQLFLQEQEQLNDSLRETYRFLKVVRDSFDPLAAARPPATIPNILELARTNHLLADSVKFRLLPAMPVFPSALDVGILNGATPAQKLTSQILGCGVDPDPRSPNANLLRLPADKLHGYDRYHPQVRYENITFNCCSKCKGEIQVL